MPTAGAPPGPIDAAALLQGFAIIWAMRKITNSAGFTGARPISTIILPSRRSCGVIEVPSPTLT